jgi:hypothetical protein
VGGDNRKHPSLDQLQGFLRGDIAVGERLSVVRHLLAGCPECVAVTRQGWRLTEQLCCNSSKLLEV